MLNNWLMIESEVVKLFPDPIAASQPKHISFGADEKQEPYHILSWRVVIELESYFCCRISNVQNKFPFQGPPPSYLLYGEGQDVSPTIIFIDKKYSMLHL